ncbi:MAG: bifunctional hydroxymethylpyrimidine kinase/phosphomethylpyrimidine kinase [Bacteroidales bacterium]|jgi:hydroxymethylpyrimidine/phosphomethylpyrimidine kinase|nr:bifunctional hydroxymethylpyrimidine kinase/phosphomethylpyrimidine kinase [Bacteroidales bacterium]
MITETRSRYITALTIAGSDSGGGAGIQADLKTFSALGVFGTSVITSVTAQNTREVRSFQNLKPDFVRLQLETILDDIRVDAVKTGMLPEPKMIEHISRVLAQFPSLPLVVDPVMVSTSGAVLVKPEVEIAFRQWLYPRLTLLTPNIPEAEFLTGQVIKDDSTLFAAGNKLLQMGCKAVLIKGGHRDKVVAATDILFQRDTAPLSFSSPLVHTRNLHGTGCTYSAAIAALLAKGSPLVVSIREAKKYVGEAIETGAPLGVGHGHGPVCHFFKNGKTKLKTIQTDLQ